MEIRPASETLGDMPAEEFRRFGYQVVDWVAEYLGNMERYPVLSTCEPGQIKESLPKAPPGEGEGMAQILEDLDRLIVPGITHWNHPAFFSYFSITGSAPGILADLLCAAFNVNAMLWQTSPAATELEEVTLGWLRDMLGLPADFWGIIYDTASISTLHALAAARENVSGLKVREKGLTVEGTPKLRLYTSQQAHSSVEKAAIMIGIGHENVRKIAVDTDFRMDVAALQEAIEEDLKQGMRPFCVAATVGTTSTTSVDPVRGIADLCERYGLWLHVDAAYAGPAAILPEMRPILAGCERADSFVTNPHKWLFTPIDLSAFYCRHPEVLKRAFSLVPEYLKTTADEVATNYMDYGIQLGRRFRALKLWMIIRYFGRSGLEARIRQHIRWAQELVDWIEQDPDFEMMAPAPFSTVCFRAAPADWERDERTLDRLNTDLLAAVNETGELFLSHTRLHDKFVLRFAIGNVKTEKRHLERAWEILKNKLRNLKSRPGFQPRIDTDE